MQNVSMGEPRPQKLYCAWKDELKRKVGEASLENYFYKLLRTAMEATEESTFKELMTLISQTLKDEPKLARFEHYHHQNWSTKVQQWAHCHRVGLEINTNMFAEAFHRTFKYDYLKGKVNKRLDKCILALIKFSQDKGYQRLQKLTKGKITARIGAIRKHHLESQRISQDRVQQMDEKVWNVNNVNGPQNNYRVVKEDREPSEVEICQLRCTECDICVHTYTCSCPVNLIRGSVCWHIHLVQKLHVKKDQIRVHYIY